MTETAILAASGLLLFAYLVDIVGRRFKLLSIVPLIATGIALRYALDPAGLSLKWVDPIVPIPGTLGLVLIVLEGALGLAISRDRARPIAVSSASAALGFGIALAGIAALCTWRSGHSRGTARGERMTIPRVRVAAPAFAPS